MIDAANTVVAKYHDIWNMTLTHEIRTPRAGTALAVSSVANAHTCRSQSCVSAFSVGVILNHISHIIYASFEITLIDKS